MVIAPVGQRRAHKAQRVQASSSLIIAATVGISSASHVETGAPELRFHHLRHALIFNHLVDTDDLQAIPRANVHTTVAQDAFCRHRKSC